MPLSSTPAGADKVVHETSMRGTTSSYWSCRSCTYNNSPRSASCCLCGRCRPRLREQTAARPRPGAWLGLAKTAVFVSSSTVGSLVGAFSGAKCKQRLGGLPCWASATFAGSAVGASWGFLAGAVYGMHLIKRVQSPRRRGNDFSDPGVLDPNPAALQLHSVEVRHEYRSYALPTHETPAAHLPRGPEVERLGVLSPGGHEVEGDARQRLDIGPPDMPEVSVRWDSSRQASRDSRGSSVSRGGTGSHWQQTVERSAPAMTLRSSHTWITSRDQAGSELGYQRRAWRTDASVPTGSAAEQEELNLLLDLALESPRQLLFEFQRQSPIVRRLIQLQDPQEPRPSHLPWQLLVAHQQLELAIDHMSYDELYEHFGGGPVPAAISCEEAATLHSGIVSSKHICCGLGAAGNKSCPICLQLFVTGEHYKSLSCSHVFHKDCIDTWLVDHRGDCPICRSPAAKK